MNERLGTRPVPRQDEIDRGEAPATTVRQLVSAVRQNLAALGADLRTLEIARERGLDDDYEQALARVHRAVNAIDAKVTMAMEAIPRA